MGADDDYLTKPFSYVVLLAHLRAVIRRGAPKPSLLTGVLAAVIASLAYGSSAMLQVYAAQRIGSEAQAAGVIGQYGAATMIPTVRAALTLWFVVGVGLDLVGFVGGAVAGDPAILTQTIVIANLVVTRFSWS